MRTSENPVRRLFVGALLPPVFESFHQGLVEWYRPMGRFRLADAYDLLDEATGHPKFSDFEIDVLPLQAKQLALSQPRANVQKHQHSLSRRQCRQQVLHLFEREHAGSGPTFGALAHPLDGITVVKIVATGVVKENAHHVADLSPRAPRAFHACEPQLHFPGFNTLKVILAPTRHNPFLEIALIRFLGGVRDSRITVEQFALTKVIRYSSDRVIQVVLMWISCELISLRNPTVAWLAARLSGSCSTEPRMIRRYILLPLGPGSSHL